MKCYGYLTQPLAIVDFVHVIYKKNSDFYVCSMDDDKQQTFKKIWIKEEHIEKFEVSMPIDENNFDPIFCFLKETKGYILGTYFDVYEPLLNLLTSNKLSIYSQMSVFKFLQMNGRLFGLLLKLRSEYSLGKFPYLIQSPLEDEDSFIEIEEEDKAKQFIEVSRSLIKRFVGKLYWTDIFYIYKDLKFRCKIMQLFCCCYPQKS